MSVDREEQRKRARAALRRVRSQERTRLFGETAARDLLDRLDGRSGVAQVVRTALTLRRVTLVQTYWASRDGSRNFHVMVETVDDASVLVEMALTGSSGSRLVLASRLDQHMRFQRHSTSLTELTGWLHPDLADGVPVRRS